MRLSAVKCRCGCSWRGTCAWARSPDGTRLVPRLSRDSDACPRCGARDAVVRVATQGSKPRDETYQLGERVLDWSQSRDGMVPANRPMPRAAAGETVKVKEKAPAEALQELAVLMAAMERLKASGYVRRGGFLDGAKKAKKKGA